MSRQVGSRNQKGFVNRLQRVGMTHPRGGGEILANSSDAGSPKFIFKIPRSSDNTKLIRGIDAGKGMTADEFDNMYDIERENHDTDISMGVSGIGSLLAHFLFSKDDNERHQNTGIHTKSIHGEYQGSVVPFPQIIESGNFDGLVRINSLTPEEIMQFEQEREREGLPLNGVTHLWPYSQEFELMLDTQYSDKPSAADLPFDDRWSIIFGKVPMQICLDKNNGTDQCMLKKYDYMCGANIDYYAGKTIHVIEQYEDHIGTTYFTCYDPTDNVYYVINKHGTGYSQTPSQTEIQRTWRKQGEYTYTLGMRKDARVFDEDNPKKLSSAELHLNPYDAEFFRLQGEKDLLKKQFSKMPLVRNNQVITHLTLGWKKADSARGGSGGMLEHVYHRSELSYCTPSSQNNKMDKAVGIQQTKNQHSGILPKNLERLLIWLKEKDLARINAHFDRCIAHANNRLVAPQRRRRQPLVVHTPPQEEEKKYNEVPLSPPVLNEKPPLEESLEQVIAEESLEQIIAVEESLEQIIAVEESLEQVIAEESLEQVIAVEESLEQVIAVEEVIADESLEQVIAVEELSVKQIPYAMVVNRVVESEVLPVKDKNYHRQKYQEAAALYQEYVLRIIQESNHDNFEKDDGDQFLEFAKNITLYK
jgi:hypothetical protein